MQQQEDIGYYYLKLHGSLSMLGVELQVIVGRKHVMRDIDDEGRKELVPLTTDTNYLWSEAIKTQGSNSS